MPVILPPADYDHWLNPELKTPEGLEVLLHPYDERDLVATPVSTHVNNARNDGPECAGPHDPSQPEPGTLF